MRTLVLGLGNPDRGDDGVAYEVINAVRRHLGQEPLGDVETGLEAIGSDTDAVFVLQLGTEVMEVAADYDRVVFVDAHVVPGVPEVSCTQVDPEFKASALSHHLTPQTFLAWLQVLHQRQPAAFVVSVRGYSFDFGRGLSKATATQVAPAVEHVLHLLAQGQILRDQTH